MEGGLYGKTKEKNAVFGVPPPYIDNDCEPTVVWGAFRFFI